MSRRDRTPSGGARYGAPIREPGQPAGGRPPAGRGSRPQADPADSPPAGPAGRLPAPPATEWADRGFAAPPPILRGRLSSATVPAAALLPIRFFFGATFLYAGLDKILDPMFFNAASPTSIQSQLVAFARVSPIAPLVRAGEPFAVWLGILIAVAEIAIGLGALSGLAYRIAAAGGAALSLLFFLTASWATHPYYYGGDLPYAFGWIVLAIAGHGGLLVPRRILALGAGIPAVAARRTYPRSGRAGGAGGAGAPGGARTGRVPQGVDGYVASPERRAFVQLGVLALAALAVSAVAAPLRLLRGSDEGAASNAPGTGGVTATPAPSAPSAATPAPGTPAAPAATPNAALAVAKVADVNQAGGLAFMVPQDAPAPLPAGDPGVVVKLANGSYVAYDAICTHQGCTVEWDAADGVLLCPCHGAAFDPAQQARVLQGPTRQPLAALPIKVEGGSIVLSA